MAAGGSDRERMPQFTTSNYEIPSWQIEWNKPWYQQFEEKGNAQSEYNSRGHDVNCKCSLCEEDLESAFSPEPNDVTQNFEPSIDQRNQETFPSKEKQENPQNQTQERVILFSDLPEVTPSTSTDSTPNEGASSTNTSRETSSNYSDAFQSASDVNTDALFDSIGSLSAIQSISGRVTDLQTQVNRFSGEKDSREFIVLRGLLVATLGELNRIDTVGIRWLQQAKNIAMESIHDLLTQLKSKIKKEDEIY